uniref:Cytochrome c oxidase subunit 3 n=1 Tax=Aleurocanthus spiniferus TaxID=593793 RepID=A0A109NM93_ALESP|nr:cytochrome c oxidase subunit III [Aleurocanthus spiniferus]AHY04226.1 cytochrome c oxidase subunit III [Aleurocanthus spiniferus]
MMMSNHFFHLVNVSPWPILTSLSLLNLASSVIEWTLTGGCQFMFMFIIQVSLVSYQWWRDVVREAFYEGWRSAKTNTMISGSSYIIFFISSLFFYSFFLSLFLLLSEPWGSYWSLLTANRKYENWFYSHSISYTLILLGSGFFITWCHYSIMIHNYSIANQTLIVCCLLGVYFISIQMYEYMNLEFSFSDSVYGSSFYILTGFHGLHVLVGLLFIYINLVRLTIMSFSSLMMMGLEYSIWYWHFVDLVWLFLYCFVYWWGS